MIDLQDLTIEVNETGDLISLPVAYEELYKVAVDGVGLRIREAGTQTLPGQDIGSFTYRAYNAGAALGPNTFFTLLLASFGTFPLYYQYFRVGSDVNEGYVYSVTIDGITVSYTATDTDGRIDVINGLVALINGTTYGFPVNAAHIFFITETLRIETVGPQTITVSVTPGNYWISKSGLYYAFQGNYYLISETRVESDVIPAIPPVDPSYDFATLTPIGSDFPAYLYEAEYPSIDVQSFVGFYDIAEVANLPDTQITLEGYDVLPLNGFMLKFGQSFSVGIPQKLTIIYR